MATDPLAGPVARLDRAKNHLDRLVAGCEAFTKQSAAPYEVITARDAKRRRLVFKIHVREEPPPELSFIAGDFVHNARAALDNIIWALAPARVRNRNPSFPICRDRTDFSCRALPMLTGMKATVIDAIEWCQPYYGDAHFQSSYRLADLNQLWNFDKHRAPLAVGSASHMAAYAMRGEGKDFPHLTVHMGRVLAEGEEIGWIPVHPSLRDDFKPRFEFFVSFVGKNKRPVPYFGLRKAYEIVDRDVVGAIRAAL